jgi:hypothetical protein
VPAVQSLEQAMPSGPHTTTSPSSVKDLALSPLPSPGYCGIASVQSKPRRVNRRTRGLALLTMRR